jgi:tetratricopeptide (TPR) repeat protein
MWDYVEALYNRGSALRGLKRLAESLASYDKALAKQNDHVEALHDRGLTALSSGYFLEGWPGHERRWSLKDTPPRTLVASHREWKGEDVQGKRIIVHEKQSLGDTLLLSRFLTRLSS